jgi:hypothetical protein
MAIGGGLLAARDIRRARRASADSTGA